MESPDSVIRCITEDDISLFDPLQSPEHRKRTAFKCTHTPRSGKQGSIEVSVEQVPRKMPALVELNPNIDYNALPKSKSTEFKGRFTITRSPKSPDNHLFESLDSESEHISVRVTIEDVSHHYQASKPSDDLLDLFF